MNPYSFKRFLQDTNRRSHPIQVVLSEDANTLLVQGDLPDCVQDQSANIPSQLDFSFLGSEQSGFSSAQISHNESLPLDVPGPYAYGESSNHTSLPDIYPANAFGDFQSLTNTDPELANFSQRITCMPSSTLPDFISSRAGAQRLHANRPSTQQTFRDYSHYVGKRSKSLNVLSNINRSVGKRSHSCGFIGLSDDTSHQENSLFTQSPLPVSLSCVPPDLTADPPISSMVNHSAGFTYVISPEQRYINMLLLRQNELEERIRKMQTLLNDQETLISSMRAEYDVMEKRAELRIKTLEKELAEEKFHSAQDRLALIQLRNFFSETSPNPSTSLASCWFDPNPSQTFSRFRSLFQDEHDFSVAPELGASAPEPNDQVDQYENLPREP